MEPSSETNRLILSLLHELKIYKAKCLSQNTAIATILKMSPKERAELTADRVRAVQDDAHGDALADVNKEAAQLERALSAGNDVQRSLDSFLRKPI